MTLLDQAMAAVAAGEVVGVGLAGEIYCRLLGACERATDVRRAQQWLEAAIRFEAWSDFVPPTRRTHYGGILIALGRWEEAERELLAVTGRFETGYRASRLFPLLRHHAVALPLLGRPDATMTRDRLVEDLVMAPDRLRHGRRRVLPRPRRALDVGQQERDSASRHPERRALCGRLTQDREMFSSRLAAALIRCSHARASRDGHRRCDA